jgi:PleD family two-component response regulator
MSRSPSPESIPVELPEVRHHRPPLVLIVNDQEWSTRSLESILAPSGYAVLRAYTGAKGLERALAARPDVILVGAALPDMDGVELCRAMRDDARISSSTPIIVTTTGRPGRNERLAALRAGAWEYLGQPLDAEELLLRFDRFVRAKQDADRARDEGMLDALTGLYSVSGLSRRARELGSQAYRQSGPFACVVFRAEGLEHEPALEQAVREFADRLRSLGRMSDAIGRIGGAEFALFAPGANAEGAQAIVERLTEAAAHYHMAAGYFAVPDYRRANLQPQDMLTRATESLHRVSGGHRTPAVN